MDGRTLEDLEGRRWGPAPPYSTSLIRRCHELRAKPVAELSAEDLRFMIGQDIGLPFLVPRALVVLEADPLAEGDFYPGDLLASVVRVTSEFWADHPDLRGRVDGVLDRVDPERIGMEKDVARFRGTA